eukprot:3429912-Prymnesium_polylepis.1
MHVDVDVHVVPSVGSGGSKFAVPIGAMRTRTSRAVSRVVASPELSSESITSTPPFCTTARIAVSASDW